MSTKRTNRREFLKTTAAGGLAMIAAGAAASSVSSHPGEGEPGQKHQLFLPAVMNDAFAIQPEPAYVEQMQRLVADPDFADAWNKMDFARVSTNLGGFHDAIGQYNVFHTRERRLWYVQIGSGKVPPQLENKFKEDIPAGIANYTGAFAAVQDCVAAIDESGFGALLNRHGDYLTQFLSNENSYLAQVMTRFFAKAGCSTEMFAEFQGAFEPVNYRLIEQVAEGSFSNFHGVLRDSVDAQVNILNYTQENGFSYLRGQCGPPKWAIIASQILAWAGISIGAWVVVLIIVALVATLAIICALNILPDNIQEKCRAIGFPVASW